LNLLIDNSRGDKTEVRLGQRTYEIAAGGAWLVESDGAAELIVDGQHVHLARLTRPVAAARLRLRAGMPCRWSVWSEDGQGWYPPGAPPRRDFAGLPYFHGDDVALEVPAGEPLTVRVARGMEYDVIQMMVTAAAAGETVVELTPERLYDAAAKGWYGGDLHVHLNFVGDVVATPAMAAAMQHGEDLHVLNLLAANVSGERIFDREALEHWAGRDLPWSNATHIARMGMEYRNDLLGHLHAFGLTAPPSRYKSGCAGGPDWPPNSVACRELRSLGGIVGYAHTFMGPIESPAQIIGTGRPQCSARTAVIDAALGLVDSMEVLHFASATGSAEVYRRLIGAGNRLACVAGSDSMLSFTCQRMEMVASPMGWVRTYAKVNGSLTADSYAEAVRRGATFATTGPFLELSADGHGPGDTLDLSPGDQVALTCRVIGPEVEKLIIRTATGALAEGPPPQLTAELSVDEPTYVVAIAEGGPHTRSLFTHVYAHTSPVYLNVDGRDVAREEDLRWCLEWLNHLEGLIRNRTHFENKEQLDDYLALLSQARDVYHTRLAAGS
jgi:hypothetical protein